MDIDLELYRKEILVSIKPQVRISVIDISPERPQRTLVLLHGFGGKATQWQYQLRKFSYANRVIAIDLRGHGRSNKPNASYALDDLLTDIVTVLDRLGVAGKFILGGHSFGGAIAVEYALAHPERIESLILIASTGEFRLNALYRIALHLPASILRLVAPLFRKQLGAPPQILKAWYLQTLSNWNGWSKYRSLNMPTLVIRGHSDLVFPRPLYEEVARLIPGAEEVDVGASGHMVMLERREAVNRAIERFLEASPRTWRDEESDPEASSRAALVRARPWLSHYDDGVPYTIAVPRIPVHQLLRSAARRYPLHPALIFEGRRINYLHLNQEVNRFARALLSLGLTKGDRVMLLLPNLPQMVIAFYGVLKAGGVAVFSLPTDDKNELVRQVKDSGSRFMLALIQHKESTRLIQENTDLEVVIFTHPADYVVSWKRTASGIRQNLFENHALSGPEQRWMIDLIKNQERTELDLDDQPNQAIQPNDLAAIHYTGGTTASPKGVMLSHYNLVANALQTRSWIPTARDGQERFLCVLPFSHGYGMTAALNVPVAMAATLIILSQFEVADVLKTIKRYRPTIFPGVPRMYVAINDFPGVRKYGIQSIKACISGSAPLPVEVQEAFEKLTRGRLVEGYGLTEASPVTHANPLNDLRKIGSIGIPLPSTEACILDLKRGKEEVPVGHIGELAVRGPQVMIGYWKDPNATQKAITKDGWLLTGDVAQKDEEGYFRIIARKADMWYPDRPGNPAFPRDVEEVLFELPQVKEVAVVAIAGQPIAFVIARKEHLTAEALIAYARRRLPPELVPRFVIFLDDFPRTFIGKVLRRELAKRFEESGIGGRISRP